MVNIDKKIYNLFFLVAFFTFLGVQGCEESSFEKAENSFNQGSFHQSLKEFNSFLNRFPASPKAPKARERIEELKDLVALSMLIGSGKSQLKMKKKEPSLKALLEALSYDLEHRNSKIDEIQNLISQSLELFANEVDPQSQTFIYDQGYRSSLEEIDAAIKNIIEEKRPKITELLAEASSKLTEMEDLRNKELAKLNPGNGRNYSQKSGNKSSHSQSSVELIQTKSKVQHGIKIRKNTEKKEPEPELPALTSEEKMDAISKRIPFCEYQKIKAGKRDYHKNDY